MAMTGMVDAGISDFLRKRNVLEDAIKRMEEDKIDCEAVVSMNDQEMAKYLPAFGDRIALLAFAKCKVKKDDPACSSEQTVATSLHQLRKRKCPLGNKNAAKMTRKVEMGWLNFTDANTYKQVRVQTGGGTRHLNIGKNVTVREVLAVATATFFPRGMSKLGPVNNFLCTIKDFKGDPMADEKTIEDLYKEAQLKTLRLYLYTMLTKSAEPEQAAEIQPQTKINISVSSDDELPVAPFRISRNTSSTNTESEVNNASETVSTQVLQTPEQSPCTTSASVDVNVASPDQEVIFHPRHRLRLRRETQEPPRPNSSKINSSTTLYQTASEPIEIVDSEDENIQFESSNTGTGSARVEDASGRQIDCILMDFRDRYMEEGQTKSVIFRSKPLQSAIRTLERKINLKQKLFIKFSGEIGEDHGGPRREFFRLALSELHQSEYFEGPDGKKLFSHNLNLVEKQHYRAIGRLVALSLVQDGPGIHFMNKQLFKLMTGNEGDMTPQNEILSCEVCGCIDKLDKMYTFEERDQFLVTYGDWLMDRGINAYRMTLDKKEEVKNMIIKFYVFYRTSAEITQFITGMNDVGKMWDLVTANHTSFEQLFCHCPKKLTKGDFDSLCEYEFSVEGSNLRALEDETVYAWEVFLEAIEDGSAPATFPNLMTFLTGADNIPPCGFTTKITVHFYSQDVGVTRLPYVSTCSLDFWMPRGETPESLKTQLLTSLNECGGFLKI